MQNVQKLTMAYAWRPKLNPRMLEHTDTLLYEVTSLKLNMLNYILRLNITQNALKIQCLWMVT